MASPCTRPGRCGPRRRPPTRSREARSLLHALDTRASELKVDALKAVIAKDPASVLGDVKDDVATPRALLTELDATRLSPENEARVKKIDVAYEQYMTDISGFVDRAVANQSLMRTRISQIQTANDKSDEVLGSAIDEFDGDSQKAARSLTSTVDAMRLADPAGGPGRHRRRC